MKKISLICSLFAAMTFIGCKNDKKEVDPTINTEESVQEEKEVQQQEIKTLSVTMEPKSNSSAQGEVFFSEANGVVTLEAKFSGLTPGTHAIHLHEKADCSAADGTSAGGHWNPTHSKHGKWGDQAGYHKGDIGNFEVDQEGSGKITMLTDQWCIGCGDEKKDILGKAVIVHEGADDFTTQPTGAAGGRIACGGIIE
ncbi:MAG: superoxide dismutase [Aequorivita sp.]|nr:superoxide dismutase [Aequorivita sp.]|tara:strand:+ start:31984 stop:32574 length:591 start_codon:yes stop_codon:yes gene_type:complete